MKLDVTIISHIWSCILNLQHLRVFFLRLRASIINILLIDDNKWWGYTWAFNICINNTCPLCGTFLITIFHCFLFPNFRPSLLKIYIIIKKLLWMLRFTHFNNKLCFSWSTTSPIMISLTEFNADDMTNILVILLFLKHSYPNFHYIILSYFGVYCMYLEWIGLGIFFLNWCQ